MSERTALYRFYDETGALLYVGITNDTKTRWPVHAREKAWWPDVHRTTVEWKATRAEAEAAEAEAVGREGPRWNVIRPDENGKMLQGRNGGRPATGKTAVRKLRADDGVWNAVKAKAKEEGRTITDVVVTALHRYASTPAKTDEPPAEG